MLALKAQKILIVLYHTVKWGCKWSWLNPHFWSQIAHCAFTEEEYYVSHFYWLGDTFQVIPHVCDKFSHSKIPKIAYFPAIFFVWNIFFLLWNFKKKITQVDIYFAKVGLSIDQNQIWDLEKKYFDSGSWQQSCIIKCSIRK